MPVVMIDEVTYLDTIRDRPFKIAMSLFAIYSGVSGLVGFGSSNIIFDAAVHFSYMFNSLFIVAGLTTLIGVFWHKLNIEASGLLLISISLIIRMLSTVAIVGWDASAHNLLALCILFSSASAVRIFDIMSMYHVAREKH